MEIYLVRHGQTLWNTERRFQGATDIELNYNGRELAGITGRALENVEFDVIYSSPLARAYETACLIRGHRNIEIIKDTRLREMSFGKNEGHREEEILKDENNSFRFFFTNPDLYLADDTGESFEQVIARGRDFMRDIVERNNYKRILITGHGAINKAILAYIEDRKIKDFWKENLQKNCGVTIIDYSNKKYTILDDSKVYWN